MRLYANGQTGMDRRKTTNVKTFQYFPGIHFNDMLLVHVLGQKNDLDL